MSETRPNTDSRQGGRTASQPLVVLNDCAEIRQAAVVAKPDEQLGEVVVACVVPTPGSTLTTEHVIALFENRLAAYSPTPY